MNSRLLQEGEPEPERQRRARGGRHGPRGIVPVQRWAPAGARTLRGRPLRFSLRAAARARAQRLADRALRTARTRAGRLGYRAAQPLHLHAPGAVRGHRRRIAAGGRAGAHLAEGVRGHLPVLHGSAGALRLRLRRRMRQPRAAGGHHARAVCRWRDRAEDPAGAADRALPRQLLRQVADGGPAGVNPGEGDPQPAGGTAGRRGVRERDRSWGS